LVDDNSEVTDTRNWLDGGARQDQRVGRALRQMTRRSEPNDFRFGRIKAQSVAGHPGFRLGRCSSPSVPIARRIEPD